tara:strand:- start:196 stop:333 length:138 start_codon:yes stop_codon:yes gene_type:complete
MEIMSKVFLRRNQGNSTQMIMNVKWINVPFALKTSAKKMEDEYHP